MSTYIDIKTVYESAQIDNSMANRIAQSGVALTADQVKHLLLLRAFLTSVVHGLRDDMLKQIRDSSWIDRIKDTFQGTSGELFESLNEFLYDLDRADFVDIGGIIESKVTTTEFSQNSHSTTGETAAKVGAVPEAGFKTAQAQSADRLRRQSQRLLRSPATDDRRKNTDTSAEGGPRST